MTTTLNISTAVDLAAIINAAQRNEAVARLVEGRVFIGTARAITDEHGGFLGSKDDVRDGYLWITGDMGFEHFIPLSELLPELAANTFIVGYQR